MAVKIGNIGKYIPVPVGRAIDLPGEGKRKVRLEVNCEYETRFDVVQEGTVTFLAKLEGHHMIEFIVDGPAAVQPTSEGEVWLSKDEGPHLVYETDEKSFVELDFTRTELSHFEQLQAIANLKREQREQETEALLIELRAERAALEAAKNEQTQVSGNPPAGSEAPAPAASAGEPKQESAGAAGQSGATTGASGATGAA